jgi:hypothetical protein
MCRVNGGLPIATTEDQRDHACHTALIGAIFLLTLVPIVLSAADIPEAKAFRVIVNAANKSRSLTRTEISRLFLKKVDWPTHQPVLPVDLPEDSPVRKLFSALIVGREVSSVNSYWQFMIFSGRATPPVSVQSDEEVLKYVRLHREAVGYVSASTPLEPGVLEIAIKGDSRQ